MNRSELKALLLSLLLTRPRASNPMAQAVADLEHVEAALNLIEKASMEKIAQMLEELALEDMAVHAAKCPHHGPKN